MSTDTAPHYTPIPAEVQEACDRLRAVAEEHGFSMSTGIGLHTDAVIEEGEDRVRAADRWSPASVTRYWPSCGGGEPVVVMGRAPADVEAQLLAAPAEMADRECDHA